MISSCASLVRIKIFQIIKVKTQFGAYRVQLFLLNNHRVFGISEGDSQNPLSNIAAVSGLYGSKYSKMKKVKANCGAYRVHHNFYFFYLFGCRLF